MYMVNRYVTYHKYVAVFLETSDTGDGLPSGLLGKVWLFVASSSRVDPPYLSSMSSH